jgi:hypothetical protein
MDDRTNQAAPRHVLEALDASVRDIAEGRVHDALGACDEARRMLEAYEAGHLDEPMTLRPRANRQGRSSS